MNRKEKKELIAIIIRCSFLMLIMVIALIYAVTHRTPGPSDMVIVSGVIAIIYGFAKIISGPVAYYKERFKEIKQEKEKHKVT